MKRKNAGLTTVEIVVAAVILVAVVAGLLIVVKLSKKTTGPSADETEATKIVETLLTQVEGYIQSADLDVNQDADNYIRFVGKNKSQFYHFDAASGQVYMIEKDTSEFGSSDTEIRTAAEVYKPEYTASNVVAKNVKTFLIELVDKDTVEGSVKTTVRAEVGSSNIADTKNTKLNAAVIQYFADRAGHDIEIPTSTPTPIPTNTATPTPVPTEDPGQPTPADSTPTPEPTAAADTPTPTPEVKEHIVKIITDNPQNNSHAVIVNTLVIYPMDATIHFVVRRSSEETEFLNGSTIGGIGFDVYVPTLTFDLDHDPAYEEEITFSYNLGELKGIADASNIKKLCVKINDNTGYSLVRITVEYDK